MHGRIWKRSLAVLLTAALAIQAAPVTSLAVGTEPEASAISGETAASLEYPTGEDAPEPDILAEDETKREPGVKHFRRSDGSYVAAIYSEPVHYEKDGKLLDIDNTLVEKDGYYTNTANSLVVRLPKQASTSRPITVEHQGKTLRFFMEGQQTASAALQQADSGESISRLSASASKADKQREKNERKLQAKKQHAAVTYPESLDGASLTYDVKGSSLKESLILKKLTGRKSYSFKIEAEGLRAEVQADSSVHFYAEGTEEPAFIIASPYMFDAAGEYSSAVAVEVKKTGNHYRYTLTPDRAWLEDSARVWPVTVDPTIQTEQDFGSLKNAFVSSGQPDIPHYNFGVMHTGYQVTYKYLRSYWNVTLPSLPGTARIIGADFNLYTTARDFGPSESCVFSLHEVIERDWTEANLKWSYMPKFNSRVLDYAVYTNPHQSSGQTGFWTRFDVTSTVQKWYDGSLGRFGLMLKAYDEEGLKNAGGADIHHCSRYSPSFPEGARTVFQIAYRDTKGVEDYWTYTSLPAGRGTVAVNNFNGNLIMTEDDIGNDGARMPVTISHIYNASGSNIGYCGTNWRTNFNMSIEKTTGEVLARGYKYYLLDADGTEHYFYFKDANGNATASGKDEDGLGYTLTDTGTGDAKYVITDKDGGKMQFWASGKLATIHDTNGNFIRVTYNAEDRINTVYDGAGRNYSFFYNGPRLSHIKDSRNRQTTYNCDGDNLVKITYPDGAVVEMAYSGALLTKITNKADNTVTTITYTGSSPKRVASISYGPGTAVNTKYSFTYKHNATTITSNTGDNVTYQFNNAGQTVGVVNNVTGQGQAYQYGAPDKFNGKDNKLLTASKSQQSVTNLAINPSFNRDTANFTTYKAAANSNSVTIDSNKGHIGKKSAKFTQTASNPGQIWLGQDIKNLSAGFYTFSAYVNTGGTSVSGRGVVVDIEPKTSTGANAGWTCSESVTSTGVDEWKRIRVTALIPEGYTARILIGFIDKSCIGTVWFDDLQFEKTENANSFNLLENTNFKNGTTNWNVGAASPISVVTDSSAPHGGNALKMNGMPFLNVSSYTLIPVDGKAGDVFTYGGWAKASSISTVNNPKSSARSPVFQLYLSFRDENKNYISGTVATYNHAIGDWQYTSGTAKASKPYSYIQFFISYDNNAGEVRLTAPYVYKEEFGQTYDYDKDGNLQSSVDLANTQSSFTYNNQQLSKLANPTGSKFLYTTNINTRNLEYAQTTDGQRYEFLYDDYGNATQSSLGSDKFVNSVSAGKAYYIRNAYSGNSMDNSTHEKGGLVKNWRWTPGNSNQMWKLISTSESDVYELCPTVNTGARLDIKDASTANNAVVQLHTANGSNAQKFKILRNSDGTFCIRTKVTGYAKSLDGQPGNSTNTENGSPMQQYANDTSEGQKWYFIEVNTILSQKPYIQTNAKYTDSGNKLESVTDERGKTTSYTYGDTSKLLTQAKDPKGNTTDYTYDNADRVKKVASGVASNEYEYAQDRLSAIWHNNRQVKYGFGYDGIGNQTSVTVGNGSASKTLTSNSYDSRNRLTSALYGNGQRVNYKYDSLDRPVIKYYNNDNPNNAGYHTVYNANGLVGLHKDVVNTQRTRYTYDLAQRLVRVRRNVGVLEDNGAFLAELAYTYENNTNRLSAYTLELLLGSGTSKVKTSFTYGNKNGSQMTDAVYEVRQNGGLHKTYTYDGLGRKTQTMMSMGGANKPIRYTYVGVKDNRTTTMLESLDNFGEKLSYTYDDNGNIETIRKNGVLQETYHYDVLNQLVRADSAAQNKSFVYAYDAGGNILSVKEYAYTTGALGTAVKTVNYGYTDGTWKDLLTSYAGQTITYDGIGNPLSYRDGLSMTWRNGRELASLTKNGVTASYLYDESGLRTKKTVGGVVTNYHVIDGRLYGEYTGSHRLLYMFDEAGTRYSFLYNGSTYYYVFNGQGDVIGITDGTGNMLARYTYDAWGKPLTITDGAGADVSGNASHIANVNPFRYRGYYYDKESGLYYLQSRYYDPVVGRFINADGLVDNRDINTQNMFQYGVNNPINNFDLNGMWAFSIGININATAFLGISLSVGFSIDGKGNWGFQFSHAGTNIENPSAGLLDIGIGVVPAYIWDADTIYDLEGTGVQAGASGGPGWYVGADCLWLENGDAVPDGISGVFGVGIGIDGHVNVPYTEKTLTVKGAPRPKGATAADMATAEYINGLGWVISDMSGKGFGWIDGIYYQYVC